MSNVPSWIRQLIKGETLIVVFPKTNKHHLAEVLENTPVDDEKNYFGILTVNYRSNHFARQDDLLYDDYSYEADAPNHWYAHIIM